MLTCCCRSWWFIKTNPWWNICYNSWIIRRLKGWKTGTACFKPWWYFSFRNCCRNQCSFIHCWPGSCWWISWCCKIIRTSSFSKNFYFPCFKSESCCKEICKRSWQELRRLKLNRCSYGWRCFSWCS